MERSCGFKTHALSVLGYVGFIFALDDATLKDEPPATVKLHARAMLFSCTCYVLAPCVVSISKYLGSISVWLFGMELLPTRAHSPTAWGKFRHPVSMNMPLFALIFEWKDKVLNSSMAQSIMEIYEVVCCLDHIGRCTESPNDY